MRSAADTSHRKSATSATSDKVSSQNDLAKSQNAKKISKKQVAASDSNEARKKSSSSGVNPFASQLSVKNLQMLSNACKSANISKRVTKICKDHFLSCALCNEYFSKHNSELEYCAECKGYVCRECDCSKYHLSYQEMMWKDIDSTSNSGGSKKSKKKKQKKKKNSVNNNNIENVNIAHRSEKGDDDKVTAVDDDRKEGGMSTEVAEKEKVKEEKTSSIQNPMGKTSEMPGKLYDLNGTVASLETVPSTAAASYTPLASSLSYADYSDFSCKSEVEDTFTAVEGRRRGKHGRQNSNSNPGFSAPAQPTPGIHKSNTPLTKANSLATHGSGRAKGIGSNSSSNVVSGRDLTQKILPPSTRKNNSNCGSGSRPKMVSSSTTQSNSYAAAVGSSVSTVSWNVSEGNNEAALKMSNHSETISIPIHSSTGLSATPHSCEQILHPSLSPAIVSRDNTFQIPTSTISHPLDSTPSNIVPTLSSSITHNLSCDNLGEDLLPSRFVDFGQSRGNVNINGLDPTPYHKEPVVPLGMPFGQFAGSSENGCGEVGMKSQGSDLDIDMLISGLGNANLDTSKNNCMHHHDIGDVTETGMSGTILHQTVDDDTIKVDHMRGLGFEMSPSLGGGNSILLPVSSNDQSLSTVLRQSPIGNEATAGRKSDVDEAYLRDLDIDNFSSLHNSISISQAEALLRDDD